MKKITFEEFVVKVHQMEVGFDRVLSFNTANEDVCEAAYGLWYGVQRIQTALDFDIIILAPWGSGHPNSCYTIIVNGSGYDTTIFELREWLKVVFDLEDINEIWVEE